MNMYKIPRKDDEPKKQKHWDFIMRKYGWEAQLFDLGARHDPDGILSLVKSHYPGADECHAEYFKWEYIDNPAGKAIIWTANRNKEIVGQYVVNPIRAKVRENSKLGSVAVKTLIREDFRGKGIHIFLAERAFQTCKERKFDFTYGFPNDSVYKSCIERLGYQEIGRVPLLIKPLDAERLIDYCLKSSPASKNILKVLISPALAACDFLFGIRTLILNNKYHNRRILLKEIVKFDQRFNILWGKIKKSYRNIFVRDEEFLSWRYMQNPKRSYKIFTAESNNGQIYAYVVLRITQVNDLKVGYIVDILSDEEELGGIGCCLLIRRALEYFRKESVAIAGCLMLRNKIYFGLLKRNGFLVCPRRFAPQTFSFMMKVHSDEIASDLCKIDNWFITLGDYDVA